MMTTKRYSLPLLGLLCLGLTIAWAADDLPKAEPFSRYEPMLKHSPFAVATAGAPVAGTPDFAKDLYVANAGHSETGDFVTIASTTNRDFKEYLTTSGMVHGYSVPNIQWSDRVGETKVTISKDGQYATLSFNEAVLSQAIQNPAAQVSRQQPGVPGIPNRSAVNLPMPFPRPMTLPTIPTPPPHTRSVIRRNVGGAQQYPRPQTTPNLPDDEPGP
ncbi:MAG: hypothetical protein H0X34_12610 [Chthoniobacterales bacterium]|nr:hypothetical protein [Chthoniobacterales bacterium]